MEEKAEEFKKGGAKIYQEVTASSGGGSEQSAYRAAPKD